MIFSSARKNGNAVDGLDLGLSSELVHALHRQIALTQDVLTSNAALLDLLSEASHLAGAQGFAQVTRRLAQTSESLQVHNDRLTNVIQSTATTLDDFTASVQAFECRFKELEGYIEHTRKRTGDIVKLALQSKILSLNARIEAARLGDEGASFNVVAGEMGELAHQTEALSNDITADLTGMLDALTATSEEFVRNKTALSAAGDTVGALQQSSAILKEETVSVVAASGEVEQIAFSQVELQEQLEGIARHAGWVQEAAGSLLPDLDACRLRLETAWRAQLPSSKAHWPDSLDEFESRLYQAIVDDQPHAAEAAVAQALSARLAPEALLDRLGTASMRVSQEQSGRSLPTETYFLNGDVIQRALTGLEPALERSHVLPCRGVVVLGNAFEDYHDLGRRLVSIALRGAGFEVIDLGLSVSNDRFVDAAREHRADVVGVSSLLLHTAKWIPRLRLDLQRANLGHVALIAGGAPFLVDAELRDRFGVDGVGRCPSDAVRLVRALVAERLGGAVHELT